MVCYRYRTSHSGKGDWRLKCYLVMMRDLGLDTHINQYVDDNDSEMTIIMIFYFVE